MKLDLKIKLDFSPTDSILKCFFDTLV